MSTETLALGAILTALVIVLQFIAAMLVRLGLFSVSLVLIPIVIGVATCGIGMGAWLGFVFGVVVLLSGDAAAFLVVDVLGTVVTVLVKGIACGLCAGLVYKLLEKLNRYVAVFAAAIVCPVVNTGVFLIGGVGAIAAAASGDTAPNFWITALETPSISDFLLLEYVAAPISKTLDAPEISVIRFEIIPAVQLSAVERVIPFSISF